MNALDFLRGQHEQMKDLLEKLGNTTGRGVKTRETLYGKLRMAILQHGSLERELLYPRMAENPELEDVVSQAEEEHLLMDQLIDDIDEIDLHDEDWKEKFDVLRENLEHHLEEEEGAVFPQVEDLLSEDDLEVLGEEMAQWGSDADEEGDQDEDWGRRHAA